MLTSEAICEINRKRCEAVDRVKALGISFSQEAAIKLRRHNILPPLLEGEAEEKESTLELHEVIDRLFPKLMYLQQEEEEEEKEQEGQEPSPASYELYRFWPLTHALNQEQLFLVYNTIKDLIPLVIRTHEDMKNVFYHFECEAGKAIFEDFSLRFSSLQDFHKIMPHYRPECFPIIVETIKKRRERLTYTTKDFWDILDILKDNHENKIFRAYACKAKEELLEILLECDHSVDVSTILYYSYFRSPPFRSHPRVIKEMKKRLPEVIHSEEELLGFFRLLESKEYPAFFEAIKDKLPPFRNRMVFADFLGLLGFEGMVSLQAKETFFQLFFDLFDSAGDLYTLIACCRTRAPWFISEALQDEKIKGKILEKISSSPELFKILPHLGPKDCILICEAVKQILPEITEITPVYSGAMVAFNPGCIGSWGVNRVRELNSDQCIAVFSTIPALFQTIGGVRNLLEQLENPSQGSAIFEAILPIIPQLLRLASFYDPSPLYDFSILLKRLSPEHHKIFFQLIFPNLPKLILSTKDLRTILMSLDLEESRLVCKALKDQGFFEQELADFPAQEFFLEVFSDRNEVIDLDIQKQEALYEAAQDAIGANIDSIQKWSNTFHGLFFLFSSEGGRSLVCNSLKESLLSLAPTARDIASLLRPSRNPEYPAAIFHMLQDHIPSLIHSARDFEIVMVNLNVEQCAVVCSHPKMFSLLWELAPTQGSLINLLSSLPSIEHRALVYEAIRGKASVTELNHQFLENIGKAYTTISGTCLLPDGFWVKESSHQKQRKLLQPKNVFELALLDALVATNESSLERLKSSFDALAKAPNTHRNKYVFFTFSSQSCSHTRSCIQLIDSVASMSREHRSVLNRALQLNLPEEALTPKLMTKALLSYTMSLGQQAIPPLEAGAALI